MSFEFRNLNSLGSRVEVSLPLDSDGLLGRECPAKMCLGYFKLKPGTGLKGKNLPCHCPYCGHIGSQDTFYTTDQIEYAKSVVLRQVTSAIVQDLKSLEFDTKPKGSFGIGMSMKVQPGPPTPIHRYREKALETHVTCDSCTLEYAVFGVFAFCPDCGSHNSLLILSRSLELTKRQLDLALTLPDAQFRAHIIEDALENCVSAFDGFGREACRVRSKKSNDPAKSENLSFQNLPSAAKKLSALFGVDLPGSIDPAEWTAAHRAFMRRHVLAHRSGVIDQRYLDETGEPASLLGRRVTVDPGSVRDLAAIVEKLAGTLLSLLPPP